MFGFIVLFLILGILAPAVFGWFIQYLFPVLAPMSITAYDPAGVLVGLGSWYACPSECFFISNWQRCSDSGRISRRECLYRRIYYRSLDGDISKDLILIFISTKAPQKHQCSRGVSCYNKATPKH